MAKGTAMAIVTKTGDRPGREVALQPETKAAKFIRLANIRATTALEALDRLANLATPTYDYNEAQITKLETALRHRVAVTIASLRSRSAKRPASTPLL